MPFGTTPNVASPKVTTPAEDSKKAEMSPDFHKKRLWDTDADRRDENRLVAERREVDNCQHIIQHQT
jgi:hypothetical protein